MSSNTITKKPLIVLNASAGSGKTRSLVKVYLDLLINNDSPESAFRHILAMTFTNKAAQEMKERIITSLHEIATNNISGKNFSIGIDIARELNVPLEEVQLKCANILSHLLHQYEEFHVMTIDKFNLRLIKSFSRDLDLPVDFEVILEESELLEKTVDQLLSQLGSAENKELNQLILAYAESNIEAEAQWNFRNSLIKFAGILTKETNFPIIDRLEAMDFSLSRLGELKKYKEEINEGYMKEIRSLRMYLDQNVVDPTLIPGKTQTVQGLNNLAALETLPIESVPYTAAIYKKIDDDKTRDAFPEELRSILHRIEQYREEKLSDFASVQLYLKNFYNMALLKYLAEALKRMRKDDQLIRISEFNQLISELIKNESTPFIYERLGNKFHHYLLDEFQDTSRLQWTNLTPLVQDALGNNKRNLIVGDPKQSIYRFKNGLAEQFVVLPKIYNPEKDLDIERSSEFFNEMGEQIPLKENWRSSPQIVKFNNAFFEQLKSSLPDEIAAYYSTVHQTPMRETNGKIRIVSEKVDKPMNNHETVNQIIRWIEEAEADGYQRNEICILGAKNKECNEWAIGLSDRGYRVVSSDSLLIMNQVKIKLAKAYLECRWSPQNETEQKQFTNLYFRCFEKSYSDYNHYFDVLDSGKRMFSFKRFVQDYFGGLEKFFFDYENLYDLVQKFYKLIEFEELKDPYLHHFADISYEYNITKGPDLKGFIDYLENKKGKLAVQVPESEDAIRVMTMHKSKGLEFPVVIVPYIDFDMTIRNPILTEVDDYVVYKTPSSKDILKELVDLYQSESNQILGDKLNLCYVTFTRPKEQLYVLNQFQNGNRFGRYIHSTLQELYPSQGDIIDLTLYDGNRTSSPDNQHTSQNLYPKPVHDQLWFPEIALQNKEELEDDNYLTTQRQFGREFHYVISALNDQTSLEDCIQQALLEGEISVDNISKLKAYLKRTMNDNAYQNLKSGASKILFEQSFIDKGGKIMRPDQVIVHTDKYVVIDFKTGLTERKNHQQVHEYVTLLRKMTSKSVEGYLLYIDENEPRIERVD